MPRKILENENSNIINDQTWQNTENCIMKNNKNKIQSAVFKNQKKKFAENKRIFYASYKSKIFKNSDVEFFVTSKFGGFSRGSFSSFNLAYHVNDNENHVDKNRQILKNMLNIDHIFDVNQVHGSDIVSLNLQDFSFSLIYKNDNNMKIESLKIDNDDIFKKRFNADGIIIFKKNINCKNQIMQSKNDLDSKILQDINNFNVYSRKVQNDTIKCDVPLKYKIAPMIMMADCAGIFVECKNSENCAFGLLHAGRNGALKNILQNAIDYLRFLEFDNFKIYISPHIKFYHYEIDFNFTKELLQNFNNAKYGVVLKHPKTIVKNKNKIHSKSAKKDMKNNIKYFFSIECVLKKTLKENNIKYVQIAKDSTFSNKKLFSYRRNKHAGRFCIIAKFKESSF